MIKSSENPESHQISHFWTFEFSLKTKLKLLKQIKQKRWLKPYFELWNI